MRHTVFGIVGIWLVSAGAVMAQGLPEGTYASSKEGCAKLEAKTTADLGDDFDFYVLTSKGLMGYEQACDFVNVSAHNAMSWVATAFCDEQGYTYPDLFSIAQKDEGMLAVTRLTDLTQQGAPETSDSEASESADQESSGETGAAKEPLAGGSQDQTAENQGASQVSAYVRCQNVKQ
jgi:hypothetical protein